MQDASRPGEVPEELRQLVDDQAALIERQAVVIERLETMLARVEEPDRADRGGVSPEDREQLVVVRGRTDRRQMLKRAATALAGAAAGGTAIAIAQQEPAAAEGFAGNPAVLGLADPPQANAIEGRTVYGRGVVGDSSTNTGVYGISYSGTGVEGRSFASIAVAGYRTSTQDIGVDQPAMLAQAAGSRGIGLRADASSTTGRTRGVHATTHSPDGIAVLAESFNRTAFSYGVWADGTIGIRARGTRAQLFLEPYAGALPPLEGNIQRSAGEIMVDTNRDLWYCSGTNTPGVWRKLAGGTTSGSLHMLLSPKRVYDSRPGQPPTSVGPKTPLLAETPLVIDLKAAASGVPMRANAVLLSLVATGTTTGLGGFMTVYRNGVTWPGTSNLNWSAANQTIATTTLTGVDIESKCQVYAGSATDVIVDVLGYYQ